MRWFLTSYMYKSFKFLLDDDLKIIKNDFKQYYINPYLGHVCLSPFFKSCEIRIKPHKKTNTKNCFSGSLPI